MKTVEELISERDAKLKAHPELQAKQDEYEKIMSMTPPDKKLEVSFILMTCSLVEMQKAWNELQSLINEAKEAENDG